MNNYHIKVKSSRQNIISLKKTYLISQLKLYKPVPIHSSINLTRQTNESELTTRNPITTLSTAKYINAYA
jgi:hypothetical protein